MSAAFHAFWIKVHAMLFVCDLQKVVARNNAQECEEQKRARLQKEIRDREIKVQEIADRKNKFQKETGLPFEIVVIFVLGIIILFIALTLVSYSEPCFLMFESLINSIKIFNVIHKMAFPNNGNP
jgi:F0F1-type ATP synthase assembly protein I